MDYVIWSFVFVVLCWSTFSIFLSQALLRIKTNEHETDKRFELQYNFPFRKYIRKIVPNKWKNNTFRFEDYDFLPNGLTTDPSIFWTPLHTRHVPPCLRKLPFKKDKINVWCDKTGVVFGPYQVYNRNDESFIITHHGIVPLDLSTMTLVMNGILLSFENID